MSAPADGRGRFRLLGVFVGLLPAVGALLVAMLRKLAGNSASVVCAAIGVAFAGIAAPPRLHGDGAHLHGRRSGHGGSRARPGRPAVEACIAALGSQAEYLGRGTVGQSLHGRRARCVSASDWSGSGLVPVIVATLTFVQARIALRRGPRWPAAFFWLPTLGVALLTMAAPALTAAHLWLGAGWARCWACFLPLARRVRRRGRSSGGRAGAPRAAARTARPAAPGAHRGPVAAPSAAPRPEPGARLPAHVRRPVGGRPVRPLPRSAEPRFRPIRRLGSGGFGRVWLAHDAKLGHVVALKAAHAPDAETEKRIQREARALAAVRHPNCVRIYDMVPAQ